MKIREDGRVASASLMQTLGKCPGLDRHHGGAEVPWYRSPRGEVPRTTCRAAGMTIWWEEYKRGFGVPTLIAVHPENDPKAGAVQLSQAENPLTTTLRTGRWS